MSALPELVPGFLLGLMFCNTATLTGTNDVSVKFSNKEPFGLRDLTFDAGTGPYDWEFPFASFC